MATILKPITTQKVVAVLRRAGFRASVNRRRHAIAGYEVHRRYDGCVKVEHTFGHSGKVSAEGRDEWLAKYRATLEAAGVVVELERDLPPFDHYTFLVCRGAR